MLNKLFGLFSDDLSIDLGTANTLIFVKDKGIVLNEPSVVAVQRNPRKVIAVGIEAKRMLGRAPETMEVIRPMRDGQIADYEITNRMLSHFIQRVYNGSIVPTRPRILICVPTRSTEGEKRTIRESAQSAGAREVYLIEEPVAAAVGAGLEISSPGGNLVVDIGGGTTDVAIISLNGIVKSESIRVGGDELDSSIMSYVRNKEGCLIGEITAEKIKKQIGTAIRQPRDEVLEIDVKAHNLATGVPSRFTLDSDDMYEALKDPVKKIVDAVKKTMEQCPAELSADIAESGMVLTGGGALLRGLDHILREETGLPVIISEDPLLCVAQGCGIVLDNDFRALYVN